MVHAPSHNQVGAPAGYMSPFDHQFGHLRGYMFPVDHLCAGPHMSGTPASFAPAIIAEAGLQVGISCSSVIHLNPIRSTNG